MGKLSNFANVCIENLFLSKTLALEEENMTGVFSKQMQLSSLESKIKNFINLHPNGSFNIRVFDEETEIPVDLVIINCPTEVIRYEYILEIDPSWSDFTAIQLSESKEHKIVLKPADL